MCCVGLSMLGKYYNSAESKIESSAVCNNYSKKIIFTQMKFVLLKHPPDPSAPATACAKDFWKGRLFSMYITLYLVPRRFGILLVNHIVCDFSFFV